MRSRASINDHSTLLQHLPHSHKLFNTCCIFKIQKPKSYDRCVYLPSCKGQLKQSRTEELCAFKASNPEYPLSLIPQTLLYLRIIFYIM